MIQTTAYSRYSDEDKTSLLSRNEREISVFVMVSANEEHYIQRLYNIVTQHLINDFQTLYTSPEYMIAPQIVRKLQRELPELSRIPFAAVAVKNEKYIIINTGEAMIAIDTVIQTYPSLSNESIIFSNKGVLEQNQKISMISSGISEFLYDRRRFEIRAEYCDFLEIKSCKLLGKHIEEASDTILVIEYIEDDRN